MAASNSVELQLGVPNAGASEAVSDVHTWHDKMASPRTSLIGPLPRTKVVLGEIQNVIAAMRGNSRWSDPSRNVRAPRQPIQRKLRRCPSLFRLFPCSSSFSCPNNSFFALQIILYICPRQRLEIPYGLTSYCSNKSWRLEHFVRLRPCCSCFSSFPTAFNSNCSYQFFQAIIPSQFRTS